MSDDLEGCSSGALLEARISAEREITARALRDPEHLAKIVAAGICPELLKDDYAKRVFTAQAAGVDLASDEQLQKAGLIDGNYVELTRDNILIIARFGSNLDAVVSAQLRDRRQAVAARLIDGDDLKQISADVLKLDALRPRKAELLDKLEARRVMASAPPPQPDTRLYLAGKPIATPGNLVTMIARSKAGKTASVSAIIASSIAAAAGTTGLDTLGFTASNPMSKALISIDTEQSPYDAHVCHMRALKCAATDKDPPWLRHYSLAGYSAPELCEALRAILEEVTRTNTGIFMIVLDGVADFVFDVNDPKESNAVVTALHALAIQYDCPIVCVIHSNESFKSGDDGRGHLGKQLTRKAESNLLLKRVGEVTTITSEKQRKAPITVADGIAFKWSEEKGTHVSCNSPTATKESLKTDKLRDLAIEVFGTSKTLRWTELKELVANARDLKGNTPGRWIEDMRNLGVIRRAQFGLYELVL